MSAKNKSIAAILDQGILCVNNGYHNEQSGNLCQAADWYKEGIQQFREALKAHWNSQEAVENLQNAISHFLHRVKVICQVLEAVNTSRSQETRDNVEAKAKILVEHEDEQKMRPATECNGAKEKREGEIYAENNVSLTSIQSAQQHQSRMSNVENVTITTCSIEYEHKQTSCFQFILRLVNKMSRKFLRKDANKDSFAGSILVKDWTYISIQTYQHQWFKNNSA